MYSKDLLPYDLEDISSALDKMGMEERREGETAFPSIASMVSEVIASRRGRRIAKDKFYREQERKNTEQHMKDHPEDYFSISDMVKQLQGKFGAGRTEAK